MANVSLDADSGIFYRIAAAVEAIGQTLAKAITINASAEARLREVHRLQALSDTELAKLGIPRDRITHHVFRDIYMI